MHKLLFVRIILASTFTVALLGVATAGCGDSSSEAEVIKECKADHTKCLDACKADKKCEVACDETYSDCTASACTCG
jgi:hypothetical protein